MSNNSDSPREDRLRRAYVIATLTALASNGIALLLVLSLPHMRAKFFFGMLFILMPWPLIHAVFGLFFRYIRVRNLVGFPTLKGNSAFIFGAFMLLIVLFILALSVRAITQPELS